MPELTLFFPRTRCSNPRTSCQSHRLKNERGAAKGTLRRRTSTLETPSPLLRRGGQTCYSESADGPKNTMYPPLFKHHVGFRWLQQYVPPGNRNIRTPGGHYEYSGSVERKAWTRLPGGGKTLLCATISRPPRPNVCPGAPRDRYPPKENETASEEAVSTH